MKVNLLYRISIHDKNGQLVRRRRWRKCNSYVKQMTELLLTQMSQAAVVSTDTGNTIRSRGVNGANGDLRAAAADTSHGSLAGTGTTAVALADYTIETLIAEGASSGQMEYGAQSFGNVTTSGTTRYFTTSRVLTNSSGGTITITETGLVCSGSHSWKFLLVRDVLSSSEAVLDTETATLEYKIGVTV